MIRLKKYCLLALNILKYTLIYLIFQFICGAIEGIIFVAKYNNILSKAQIQQLIQENIMLTSTAGAIISFVIYVLLLKNKEENLWTRCRFKKVSISNVLLIFFISTGTAMVSNAFILLTKNIFKSYSQMSDTIQSNVQSFIGMVCIIILIPIFEEILFRGLIFNELRKHINLTLSIILQAAIFALFHGNVVQGIYTFVLGIVAALIYIQTKSILGNMFLHCIFNLMGSVVIPICIYYTKPYVGIYMVGGVIVMIASLIGLYKNKVFNSFEM